MAMVVKNNMSAVNTLNTLNKNQSALSQSLQKVSSGMKINSAGDDASGMAISERMRVQVRSLDQDDKNTKNGAALLRTAEGAVQSTIEVLKTLKEKAINAANDTNTDGDRRLIQIEVDKMIDQIDENALTTYNGKYLIDGTRNGLVVGDAPNHKGTYTSFTNMSLATDTTGSTRLVNLYRRDGNSVGIHSSDTITASWTRNGVTYTGSLTPIGTRNLAAAISIITSTDASIYSENELVGVDAYGRDVFTPDNQPGITIRATNPGIDGQIAGVTFAVTDRNGKMRNEVNAVLDAFKETVRAQNPSPDNALVLQTGTRANQEIKVGFTDRRSVALGLQSQDGAGWDHNTALLSAGVGVVGDGPKIQVTTREAANAAINVFENALIKATDEAVNIGAVQNRLKYTSNNLVVASENVQASESTIRDADMAKEMTAYTKNNVLTQASQAMLAQANQNSSTVLSLLK